METTGSQQGRTYYRDELKQLDAIATQSNVRLTLLIALAKIEAIGELAQAVRTLGSYVLSIGETYDKRTS